MNGSEVVIDRCPLCGEHRAVEDSLASANLYSEMLARLSGCDEQQLLRDHMNWRCLRCDLIYKRRWFAEPVVRQLFTGAVAKHPKGWDAVLGRFAPEVFERTVDEWSAALNRSDQAATRRGRRELISIVESITRPQGFEPATVIAAIARDDAPAVAGLTQMVMASITEPAPFRRFAGFCSGDLWDYLQLRTGGFDSYAEIGCPLWGLLRIAAGSARQVAFLRREEPNYWSSGCMDSGELCTARLLADQRITDAEWTGPERYSLIGLFQYLDHVGRPWEFLTDLFAKADSAAIILDNVDSPVAIQHLTGWTAGSLGYVADRFGRQLHADYAPIRSSGNVLYLLAGAAQ